jgi:hypothetical protein
MENILWQVRFEDDFYIFSRGDGYDMYDIHSERCRTEKALAEWIDHLSKKTWWNNTLEQDFISLYNKNGAKNV